VEVSPNEDSFMFGCEMGAAAKVELISIEEEKPSENSSIE
jgi:hypothetical protein